MAIEFIHILNLASTVAIVATGFLIFYQLRESNKTRRFKTTLEAINIIANDDIKKLQKDLSRDKIRLNDLEVNQELKIQKLSYAFNRLGLFYLNKLVDRSIVNDMFSETIVNTWKFLEPYIEEKRGKDKPKRWQIHFQKMAKYAEEHIEKNVSDHIDLEVVDLG